MRAFTRGTLTAGADGGHARRSAEASTDPPLTARSARDGAERFIPIMPEPARPPGRMPDGTQDLAMLAPRRAIADRLGDPDEVALAV